MTEELKSGFLKPPQPIAERIKRALDGDHVEARALLNEFKRRVRWREDCDELDKYVLSCLQSLLKGEKDAFHLHRRGGRPKSGLVNRIKMARDVAELRASMTLEEACAVVSEQYNKSESAVAQAYHEHKSNIKPQ